MPSHLNPLGLDERYFDEALGEQPELEQAVEHRDKSPTIVSSTVRLECANLSERGLAGWRFDVRAGLDDHRASILPQLERVVLRTWPQANPESAVKGLISGSNLTRNFGARSLLVSMSFIAYPGEPPLFARLRHEVSRHALALVRTTTSLPVTILSDYFDEEDTALFRSFGERLFFGIRIPTIRQQVLDICEPESPNASTRLSALRKASWMGLRTFAAVAPMILNESIQDNTATMRAAADCGVEKIFAQFHPVRRWQKRMLRRCQTEGLHTEILPSSNFAYENRPFEETISVATIAQELGLRDRLRLWPNHTLGRFHYSSTHPNIERTRWLNAWWERGRRFWIGERGTVAPA